MSLVEVHGRLANTALLYFFILALWGVWRYLRKQGMDSSYWGALAIAEILILVQGALGSYLWLIGLRPGRSLHFLYGIAVALVIPGVYAYTRGDQTRRVALVYGVALLFSVGLLLRAMLTGEPGAG